MRPRLIKIVKAHTKKDGSQFKKTHFYLEFQDNIRCEILPADYKNSNGYYNNHSSNVLNMFAEYEKE